MRRAVWVSGGRGISAAALGALALLTFARPVSAMPQFARKYNLPCATCHTMMPRLTPFGYSFLKAGYRLPNSDDRVKSFMDAMSFMTDITAQDTGPGGNTGFDVPSAETQVASSLNKHLSAHIHYILSSQSEAASGFAETYARYNSGAAGRYWHAQVGQVPVLTGYNLGGAREITETPSMMLGGVGPLTGNNQGNFAVGGLERGLEVGYNNQGFDARLSWLNGVNEAGQGDVTLQGHRLNDFALQGDYLIGNHGSSVGGFYYHGKTPLLSVGYDDSFFRGGLVGSWDWIIKPGQGVVPDLALELNGGLLWGEDKTPQLRSRSNGSILELDLYRRNRTAFVARYDSIKASDVASTGLDMTSEAYTLAIAHRPSDYYRLLLEYRKQTNPGEHSIIGSFWLFF